MKFEFLDRCSNKASNIKFHENPSNGSRVVPRGWTDDMTKLIVAFHKFANAPKKTKLKYATLFGTFLIPSVKKYANSLL